MFDCEGEPAIIDALVSHNAVPIRYRVGGVVPRTSDIDPGCLAWTTASVSDFTEGIVEPRLPRFNPLEP